MDKGKVLHIEPSNFEEAKKVNDFTQKIIDDLVKAEDDKVIDAMCRGAWEYAGKQISREKLREVLTYYAKMSPIKVKDINPYQVNPVTGESIIE